MNKEWKRNERGKKRKNTERKINFKKERQREGKKWKN